MRLEVTQPWKDISNPSTDRVVTIVRDMGGKEWGIELWYENDDLEKNLERLRAAQRWLTP